MRFEVPQFIEVEAKIFGPLTWKQFIYLAGGAGVVAVLYLTTSFIWVVLIGVPFGILAVTLAFHKINNRPLSIFLESAVNYLFKSRMYLWKKQEQQTITQKREEPIVAPTVSTTTPAPGKSSIASLAQNLEANNFERK